MTSPAPSPLTLQQVAMRKFIGQLRESAKQYFQISNTADNATRSALMIVAQAAEKYLLPELERGAVQTGGGPIIVEGLNRVTPPATFNRESAQPASGEGQREPVTDIAGVPINPVPPLWRLVTEPMLAIYNPDTEKFYVPEEWRWEDLVSRSPQGDRAGDGVQQSPVNPDQDIARQDEHPGSNAGRAERAAVSNPPAAPSPASPPGVWIEEKYVRKSASGFYFIPADLPGVMHWSLVPHDWEGLISRSLYDSASAMISDLLLVKDNLNRRAENAEYDLHQAQALVTQLERERDEALANETSSREHGVRLLTLLEKAEAELAALKSGDRVMVKRHVILQATGWIDWILMHGFSILAPSVRPGMVSFHHELRSLLAPAKEGGK